MPLQAHSDQTQRFIVRWLYCQVVVRRCVIVVTIPEGACQPSALSPGIKQAIGKARVPGRTSRVTLSRQTLPVRDATAVNTTRWQLLETLQTTRLPVKTGSGGRTKWNRSQFGLPKAHWLDAACTGEMETIAVKVSKPLLITCVGHGTRQMCRTDKFGFPNRHKTRQNLPFGFQTGDIVKAVVTKGKKVGVYIGKVACRAGGRFNINTPTGLIQGISHKVCRVLHHKDGYAY